MWFKCGLLNIVLLIPKYSFFVIIIYKEYNKIHGITINKLTIKITTGKNNNEMLKGIVSFGIKTDNTINSFKSPPAITPTSHNKKNTKKEIIKAKNKLETIVKSLVNTEYKSLNDIPKIRKNKINLLDISLDLRSVIVAINNKIKLETIKTKLNMLNTFL